MNLRSLHSSDLPYDSNGQHHLGERVRHTNIPKYLYHGTSNDRVPAIKRDGLRPDLERNLRRWPYESENFIYLASTVREVRRWMEAAKISHPAILQIDTTGLNPAYFGTDHDLDTSWTYSGMIPAANIRGRGFED